MWTQVLHIILSLTVFMLICGCKCHITCVTTTTTASSPGENVWNEMPTPVQAPPEIQEEMARTPEQMGLHMSPAFQHRFLHHLSMYYGSHYPRSDELSFGRKVNKVASAFTGYAPLRNPPRRVITPYISARALTNVKKFFELFASNLKILHDQEITRKSQNPYAPELSYEDISQSNSNEGENDVFDAYYKARMKPHSRWPWTYGNFGLGKRSGITKTRAK